jgi:WD repeat-containing protein 23
MWLVMIDANFRVASAWNGYNMSRGTCTLHSFNEGPDDEGEPPMARSMNAVLQPASWQNGQEEEDDW